MWARLRDWSRRIVLALGIVCSLALVLFVHPHDDVPTDRTVLKFWQVRGSEDIEPPAPGWFNESQNKIHVQPIGLPFLEIEQKFLTASVGNIPPDLFEYFGSVAQWSTRGALMPLDEFMKRDGYDKAQIFPALWDEMSWDGRTYAIPTGSANEAFYWNKQHFRDAGLDPERPPKTWKELEEYAVKLTRYDKDRNIEQAGYIPGYWSPFPSSLFLNWPVQKGAEFLNSDGTKVNLTASANIEALDWEGKLFDKLGRDALLRKRASFGFGPQHGFMSGQVSMIVQKSSFVQEIEKDAPKMDYGVAMLPVPDGGNPAVIAGSVWIGIPTGAKDPVAAWEFIKFYTSRETQIRAAKFAADNKLAAFFPSNIEAANSDFQQSLPHMKVFVDSMKWAHPATVVPLAHTQFWRAYQEAWDRVIRGDASAKDALTAAESQVQRGLDEQLAYNLFYRDWLRKKSAEAGQ